jgi:hypothetical protein
MLAGSRFCAGGAARKQMTARRRTDGDEKVSERSHSGRRPAPAAPAFAGDGNFSRRGDIRNIRIIRTNPLKPAWMLDSNRERTRGLSANYGNLAGKIRAARAGFSSLAKGGRRLRSKRREGSAIAKRTTQHAD